MIQNCYCTMENPSWFAVVADKGHIITGFESKSKHLAFKIKRKQ